jgi:hypothetical protein
LLTASQPRNLVAQRVRLRIEGNQRQRALGLRRLPFSQREVNIAVRLEGLAEPGGIVISGTAFGGSCHSWTRWRCRGRFSKSFGTSNGCTGSTCPHARQASMARIADAPLREIRLPALLTAFCRLRGARRGRKLDRGATGIRQVSGKGKRQSEPTELRQNWAAWRVEMVSRLMDDCPAVVREQESEILKIDGLL